MSEKKTRTKTRSHPFNGAPLTPGNPGNSGGKRGRSGRRPGWFKKFARDALADPATLAAIKTRARNPDAQGFWEGIKTLGKAAGEMQEKGETASEPLVIRIIQEGKASPSLPAIKRP